MEDSLSVPEIMVKLLAFKREPNLANLKDIVPYTTSGVSQVRETAIKTAIATIKQSLFESFHDMDLNVRKGLVNLLVRMNPDVFGAMREEIYSADIFKRVRSIQILGLVGKRRSVEQYLMQLIRDSDEKIRATVIRTLSELIEKTEANVLLGLLNDYDERVRANTIEALESLGNKNLVGIIARYRTDPNNRIRANALKALWTLGFTDVRSSLEDMFMSPDENMRASAAWVVGELGKDDPEFVHYIKSIKYSDSHLVRNNVIRALLKMDPSIASPFLDSLFEESEIQEVKELYSME